MNLLELWESEDFEPIPILQKKKLLRIKFPIENVVDAYLYLPQEWN